MENYRQAKINYLGLFLQFFLMELCRILLNMLQIIIKHLLNNQLYE